MAEGGGLLNRYTVQSRIKGWIRFLFRQLLELTRQDRFASRMATFIKPPISHEPGTTASLGATRRWARIWLRGRCGAAGTLAELFGAAVAHHRTGAIAEAERRYRHILTLSPCHADSLHNLGLIALHRGDATAAVELIGKAIEANDRTAEYHYNIALAWRALNRTDQVAHIWSERSIFETTMRWPTSISAMSAASKADWRKRPRAMSVPSR